VTPCVRSPQRTRHSRLILFLIGLSATASAVLIPSAARAQLTHKGVVVLSKRSGKCVQVADGSKADGASIVQSTCRRGSTTWELVPAGDHFRVVASHSGACLSVAGGALTPRSAVVQRACTGTDDQAWTLQPSGKFYRLVAKHSGMCLQVRGDVEDPGAALVQAQCGGASGQLWTMSDGFLAPGQRARLVSAHSNLCADVAAGTAALRACKAGAAARSQSWSLQRSSDGYRIVPERSGKCLTVHGDSLSDEAPVAQLSCAAKVASSAWLVRPSGRNLAIVNKHTNRCLDAGTAGRLVQRTCGGAPGQEWRISTAFDTGSWSSVVTLPLVPVGAAALSNGKVLFWAAYDAFAFGGDRGKTQTAIFDPATSSTVSVEVSNTQHDMFCPGTAMLADGRVLVNGGSSAARTSIYDPASGAWTVGGNMNVPRGYNADTILDNGKVFTIGGSWSGGHGGKLAEVWSPPGGGWTSLGGIPATPMTAPDPAGVYRGDNHAWLFSTGNGVVFHAGPSVEMNWFDTAGSGSFVSAGTRSDDSYSMSGSAVMYDVNRILKLGGSPGYDNVNALTKAYVIDITTGVTVTQTGSLAFARAYQNSVVLPDGQVFVAGGQSFAVPFSDQQSVFAGEIWSESTNAFTTVAAASVPRNYHSIALLLPDARVLVGGGGLCGAGCAQNHPDLEFYSPGYLFEPSGQPAARPAITAAPGTAAYNTPISVTTSAPVNRFVFIRMGSVTHTVNNDQRRVPAAMTGPVGGTYTVTTPANSGVAPPGYYMLFALTSAGVPSVARIIRLGPS
jgi:galactose oxidase